MKTVSITCIDALNYFDTIRALKTTLNTLKNKVNVTRVYWFSDIDFPDSIDTPVTWIKINKMRCYVEEYNFITLKLLPSIAIEDFNLIIHADGFAVNETAWDDKFFNFDYIGAIWCGDGVVGNGGFSLRSRKLYDAMLDVNIFYSIDQYINSDIERNHYQNSICDFPDGTDHIPEDNIICRLYKHQFEQQYGLVWAPPEIADQFSIEGNMSSKWAGKSLGFHGKHGIALQYGIQL